MAATVYLGLATTVPISGTPVAVIPASVSGGIITNPYAADDQNLGSTEVLYVSPIGNASLNGNNETFALQPGESWNVIPGQVTVTTVNAASGGHAFSAIYWIDT